MSLDLLSDNPASVKSPVRGLGPVSSPKNRDSHPPLPASKCPVRQPESQSPPKMLLNRSEMGSILHVIIARISAI